MHRNGFVMAALLTAFSSLAQSPPTAPPPGVEQRLKARVNQYYKPFEQAKYREAEAVAAVESRDLFYRVAKPQIWEFQLEKITFSGDFKTADVEISYLPGPPDLAAPEDRLRATGKWKLVDGQWFLVLQSAKDAPLGKGSSWQERLISRHYPEKAPAGPFEIDPQKLVFKRQGHGVVTRTLLFKNHLSDELRLEFEVPKLPGLSVADFGKTVPPQSGISFSVNYDSEAASRQPDCPTCKLPPGGSWEITVRVQPVNQTAKIQLQFE